jgi:hypothetical protein
MSNINFSSTDRSCEADETNHYSDCTENSTIPSDCTPKHSTRTLIQFWNTPHESGTTASFTYNDTDSSDNAAVNKSGGYVQDSSNSLLSVSESCNTRRLNASNDKDYSVETDNFNSSGDSTRDSIASQHDSALSITALRHKATLLEVSVDEDRNDETGTSLNSLDISASSHSSRNNIEIGICPMVDLTGKHLADIDVDVDECLVEHLESEHLSTLSSEEPAVVPLVEREEPTSADIVLPVESGSHFVIGGTKLPSRLPPLAPSPRRPFKRVHGTCTISRESPQIIPVARPNTPTRAELLMTECSSGVSKEEELQTLAKDVKAEGLTTVTIMPFSSESHVPPDDDLDLTSIHSEDSDGGIACNTRDHMIDVDSHGLLHDISVLIPSPVLADENKEEFDEKSTGTSSTDKDDCFAENLDNESSREHNQSGDTERMILNVMDAAEKAMLTDENRHDAYQQERSTFFDCDEYGPESSHCEPGFDLDPVSPKPVTEEDMVERETPLRSNSCRTDSVTGISNLVDVMATSKSISRRKLHPKGKTSKALSKIDKKVKPKNKKVKGAPTPLTLASSPGDSNIEDVENSSVSTLEIDSDKETDTSDLFWIDAFLDFVSPLEDSRSLDSDSSTSTASDSHVVHLVNTGASVFTDATSGRKASRQKKKTQTSLSRLHEWWQKELVSEVMRGNLINSSPKGDTDSVDHQATYESVEKIFSHEFHKVLSGKKVALGSGLNSANNKEKSTDTQPPEWLQLFLSTLESAKNGSLGCGVVETVAEAYGSTQKDSTSKATKNAPLDMSFDSLDGLVQKLKNDKNGTGSNGFRGRFQSLYDQLQQKLEEAHFFDIGVAKSQFVASNTAGPKSHATLKDVAGSAKSQFVASNTAGPKSHATLKGVAENGDEANIVVEVLTDDSLKYLLNPNPNLGGNAECKTMTDSREFRSSPIYSSAPVESDIQTFKSSLKSSRKSPRFAIKSYARAKEALALRRKASALRNTESENETPSTNTELPAVECDSSLERPVSPIRNLDRLDHSVHLKESSVPHQIEESDDPALCDFANDRNFDISYFQKDCTFSDSQLKDTYDKNNITKETATDHSCTEESLAIRSALGHVFLSRAHDDGLDCSIDSNGQERDMEIAVTVVSENHSGDDFHFFQISENATVLESLENVSANKSGMIARYDPLNSSETVLSIFFREKSGTLNAQFGDTTFGEDDYEELLPRTEGLPSAESTSDSNMANATNHFGHRSILPKKVSLSKLGNLSNTSNRTGLKSKARRHAERLIYSASRPIKSSVSRHKPLHMPFYDQEEKKEDNSVELDLPETSSIDALDKRPKSSINDRPFLSSFRQKARRVRRQKYQGKHVLDKYPEENVHKAGSIFSFSEQVNSNEWEDFTSSGPFSVWTK